MNAECPVCGADGALAENCGKYAAEESGQTGTSNDAPAITAADVQALIDALPEAETISEDNAADVEVQLEAIDEAKVQLSDEDFAVLDFTRYDAAVAVLMALSGEPGATFVPQAASSHTHCICGGENTVGDHTAHQAADYQPWNGSDAISYTDGKAYVYLTDNATINTNLVVDGTTLYLCLNGKEYASNGTNKIQVKNSGRLVLCDCKGTGVIKGATSGWGGMGIYLYAGTVDIFGGKFTGGKVTGNGGGGAIALEDNSSTLNIYDGEISGNNGNGKGGAIYTKSGGTINMYGGRIAKNEAYRGGGLCLTGGSTFNMYGGLLENNSSTARWDTIPANSGNLYIAGGAVMNANAGVVRGGGYAVFNLGTIQTDDANYPATKFYSGLYNMGGVVKGGMYYGSYMSAGGNLGGCEVNYTLADSNLASYHYAWQFIEPGNTPTRPDDPTKTGYLFDGWYVGENAFDFSVPVTESVRVVAKWSKCDHTGSTAQPTCTTPAICTACGGTLAALGHKWGPWTSGGNNTHTRTCKRDGSHTETKDCSGGTATCTEKAKCSVCGAEYGDLNPAHHANLVNVPAKAATTSAEGNIEYWHCGGCGKYYKDAAAQDEITQEDTVIAKRRVYYAPSLYPVRNGTNPPSGTEYSGGVYGLIFRAAVSGITGVQVDGRTVGRGSYTVEGSYPVELYLKASYLNRLAKGGHTLTVLTDSGSLTAAFTVGSGKSSPTTFDAGIAVYTAAAVTSLTGLELLRRRRKEEE